MGVKDGGLLLREEGEVGKGRRTCLKLLGRCCPGRHVGTLSGMPSPQRAATVAGTHPHQDSLVETGWRASHSLQVWEAVGPGAPKLGKADQGCQREELSPWPGHTHKPAFLQLQEKPPTFTINSPFA